MYYAYRNHAGTSNQYIRSTFKTIEELELFIEETEYTYDILVQLEEINIKDNELKTKNIELDFKDKEIELLRKELESLRKINKEYETLILNVVKDKLTEGNKEEL